MGWPTYRDDKIKGKERVEWLGNARFKKALVAKKLPCSRCGRKLSNLNHKNKRGEPICDNCNEICHRS